MQTIYTFGYEGLSSADFISRLVDLSIERVIDVRALPLSRKKGFSKRSFAQALENSGLNYSHAKVVGCPKDVRDRYKVDKDWAAYTLSYLAYLETQTCGIDEIVELAERERCCLVCFEQDYETCHRMFVAREVARVGGIGVSHVTLRSIVVDPQVRLAA